MNFCSRHNWLRTWASSVSWTRSWRRSASSRWPTTPSSRASSSGQLVSTIWSVFDELYQLGQLWTWWKATWLTLKSLGVRPLPGVSQTFLSRWSFFSAKRKIINNKIIAIDVQWTMKIVHQICTAQRFYDIKMIWQLRSFSVAEQAESQSWSSQRHPSQVKIVTKSRPLLWWRQIRQNLPWKSSLWSNFLIFLCNCRGLSKQATAERRRQFGFGSR